jgi:DNA-binding transcriptional regulator YdaS (Cro superfamily)
MKALQKAVRQAGSVAAFARSANVSPQAVHFWLAGKRRMSAHTALVIEKATGIDRRDLLPEIFRR